MPKAWLFSWKDRYDRRFMKSALFFGLLLPLAWTVFVAAANSALIPSIDKAGVEFFEKNVRPVLVERCYSCHSAQAKKLKGKLLLDTRQGVAKGGENGPAISGRDPEQSRLIQAIRWTDPDLQMPPKEKLSDQQSAALERWVRMGAPDPREAAAGTVAAAAKTIDLVQGRKWWAFQPVAPVAAPAIDDAGWARTKIDHFVLAKLRENHLEPSA